MRKPLVIGSLVLGVVVAALLATRPWERQATAGRGGSENAPATREGAARAQSDSRTVPTDPASRLGILDLNGFAHRILRLVRESGEPVPDARLTAFAHGEILAEGTTMGDGNITFGRIDDGTQLWVVAPSHIPCVLAVPALPARDVVLPRGEVVSGVVLVDEKPPTEPLQLRLHGDKAWPLPPAELPERALGDFNPRNELTTKTGDGGSFAFEGLGRDFAGVLSTPWGYPFVGERSWTGSKRLDRAQTDLILRLTRLPTITGRLVDAKTNEPLPKYRVYFDLIGPGGSSGQGDTDANARFKWELLSRGVMRVRIWVDGRVEDTPLFDADVDVSRNVDLGDLRFVSKRKLALEVVDSEGAPIAGAVASVGGLESGPTDARGRVEILCSGLAKSGLVGALGYLPASFAIPNNDDVEQRIVLAASTLVEVTIAVPNVQAIRGGFVRASSPTILFDGDRGVHYEAEVRAGAGNLINGRASDSGSEAFCQFHDSAPIRWNRLVAGKPITFELLSPAGDPLASETITLSPGEHRALELKANPTIRMLRGTVVDREGVGLPLVTILYYGTMTSAWTFAETDASGSFAFQNVFADEIPIKTRAAGFVSVERTFKTQLSADEDPIRIVLEPGRVVAATAEDSQGKPVAIDRFRAEPEGGPTVEAGIDGGVWLVKDVPEGEIALVLTAAGREWRKVHDTRVPKVRYVLPALGAVELKLAKGVPKDAYLSAYLRTEGVERIHTPRDRNPSGDTFRFPAVAPGTYELCVQVVAGFGASVDPKDLADNKKTIEVRSGETTTVTWDGALR